MLLYLFLEVLGVDVTKFITIDWNNLHTAHSCCCGISAMSRCWNQTVCSFGITSWLVISHYCC